MKIGIDISYLKDTSQPLAGLQYYLLGLLEGMHRIEPKPDIILYLCLSPSLTTSEPYTRKLLEERGIDFPLRVFHRPTRRPYRLREAWQARRTGFADLDLFQIVGTPEYPERTGRHRAFLVPDLVPLQRGDDLADGSAEYWKNYFRMALRTGELFITFSEHTRLGFIEEYKVVASKVVAIPLGINDCFHPVPAAELPGRLAPLQLQPLNYFLIVCTLEPRKNHIGLFRAYAELLNRGETAGWPLVVVGSPGWKFEPILKEPERLGIAAQVRFLGRQEDLPALYSGAGAFLYPSFNEGFGLPPLEAMACGAPVIASNAASLPEVVGDAAITVDPADVAALAEAMSKIVQDAGLRDHLSKAGLARAGKYRWIDTARQYLKAYETVCR